MDYQVESGAQRNFERWRQTGEENANKLETEEEMLDRLEAEAAETSAMGELEQKVSDAKTEMEIADALDEIRTRNARIQRAEGKGEQDAALEAADKARQAAEREKRRIEEEDERAAKRAFGRLDEDIEVPMEDAPRPGAAKGSGLRNEIIAYGDDDEDEQGEAAASKSDVAAAAAAAADDDTQTLSTATTTTAGQTVGGVPPPTFKRVVKKKKDFSAALGIKKKPALV